MMRHLILALLLAMSAARVGATDPATQPADAGQYVHGELVSVDGNRLTIRPGVRTGETPVDPVSVTTDAQTHISIDGVRALLTDLAPGMTIHYVRDVGNKRPALVSASRPGLIGKVVKRHGNEIVLRVSPGGDRTIQTDDKTSVIRLGPQPEGGPRRWTLEDIAPQMSVKVVPPEGTAKVIYLLPARAAASQPAR